MLGSITPLGERGRRQTWGITVGSFAVGAIGGGAAVGAGAGLVGSTAGFAPGPWSVWVLGALVAVGAFLDWPGLPGALPTTRRQVNEAWLGRYRGWVYGMGFGFQLGAGLVTVVSASAVYLAFVAALLSASPVGGAVVGGVFGVLRAATLVSGARVRTPSALVRMTRRLRSWDRPAGFAVSAAEAALALVAALLAVGMAGGGIPS